MAAGLTVASANVLGRLDARAARAALDVVLATEADVVCLQEWYWRRRRLLDGTAYRWSWPRIGGCVIGVRTDRLELRRTRLRVLSWPGWADRDGRRRREPARLACLVTAADQRSGLRVGVVDYHLVSQVQAGGEYRADRPGLVARHLREVARLTRVVAELAEEVDVVVAAGDSNLDGLRLPGLTSTWEGREDHAGTHGTHGSHRKIDDVHASVPVESVRLVETGADHKAVVARLVLGAG